MVQQSLSGNLEELVLTGLCYHTNLASVIAMKVTPELFQSRQFRLIAKTAIDHVMRFGEAPRNHLPDILEAEIEKGDLGKQIWQQIGRMEQLSTEIQPNYVLTELDNWIDNHTLYNTLTDALKLTEKGETTKAKELVYATKLDTHTDAGIWMHKPDEALSFLDKEANDNEFDLGIEALDIRGVRPARKTLLIFLAPKKRGKSMALVHIGKTAAFHNHQKVLHITLEMSAEKTAKRYVQSIGAWTSAQVEQKSIAVSVFKKDELGGCADIQFENISPLVLDASMRKEAAEKLKTGTRGKPRLLIKEFATGSLTTARLNMFLESLKRTDNFEPDMLIVDYAGLMHMNSNQIRTETGRVIRDLRGIAVERNIAVVSAVQGNRESENARIVGSVHLAEDWSVAGTCDVLLSICRTPEERDRRLARIFVAAARDVTDGYLVMVSQVFETCQFARDSVYFNKVAERELEQMTGD